MKHLSVDEITSFVSLRVMDDASVEFASEVNAHLRLCPECCEKVNAFQAIQDELSGLSSKNSARAADTTLTTRGGSVLTQGEGGF